MPLYDFACEKCGHVFEASARSTDPNPACPECGEGTEKYYGNVSIGSKISKFNNKQIDRLIARKHGKPDPL